MAQDREHEQALQVTADSLLTEQLALQKRLQQLTLEYESEADVVQQLQSGEQAGMSTICSNAVLRPPSKFLHPCCMKKHTWCSSHVASCDQAFHVCAVQRSMRHVLTWTFGFLSWMSCTTSTRMHWG
jgi:hypothetical protein